MEAITEQRLKPPKIKIKAKLKPKAIVKLKHPQEHQTQQKTPPKLQPPPQPPPTEHPSIVSVCKCGLRFNNNTVNKFFSNIDEGVKENNLWTQINNSLGPMAAEYFSIPIDKPHMCKYGLVISFNNDGLELSSPKLLNKLESKSNTEELLFEIFKHIARGLDELNSIGIIHLDVKPENIIVDPITFKAKIIDIGNAQEISKPFCSKPTINTKSIVEPTYPYYPPHVFYFESWLPDITTDQLLTVCNRVTEYTNSHRCLIRHYYPDNEVLAILQLIATYQRDDPRINIHQISLNKSLIRDYQRLELKMWDVYGLGITILHVLKLSKLDSKHHLYSKMLQYAIKMSYPDASKRLLLSDFLLSS